MRHLTHALPPDVANDLHGSGKGKGVILAKIGFDYVVRSFPSFIPLLRFAFQAQHKKLTLSNSES